MSIDDSSEKEFAIRKSYRGDGKKRYETVLAVNIFIFILTSNHIKKSTQLLFLLKSLFISTHETRALPTCKKSNKHFCYCIIARMFSASSFLANGAQHPFVSLSSSSTKKKNNNKPSSSFRCLSSSSSTTRKNAHQSHLLFARKSASSIRKVRVHAPPSLHKQRVQASFSSRAARSRKAFSRGEILQQSPKNKLTKKTFCSFPNNQKQARGEHSQNRAIADDTPVLGLSSNYKDSTSSSSSEERERLVAEILENVDDGGARFRERE